MNYEDASRNPEEQERQLQDTLRRIAGQYSMRPGLSGRIMRRMLEHQLPGKWVGKARQDLQAGDVLHHEGRNVCLEESKSIEFPVEFDMDVLDGEITGEASCSLPLTFFGEERYEIVEASMTGKITEDAGIELSLQNKRANNHFVTMQGRLVKNGRVFLGGYQGIGEISKVPISGYVCLEKITEAMDEQQKPSQVVGLRKDRYPS